MEPPVSVLKRAVGFAGFALSDGAKQKLLRYGEWLKVEAVPAGGVGRNEAGRVWERHVAESLVFAVGWAGGPPPPALVDLGSGAGLPGIPLAVLWPSSQVILVERSARRCSLLRRVARILELENTEVRQTDAAYLVGSFPGIVARALAAPDRMRPLLGRLLARGGTAVIGGSNVGLPDLAGFTSLEVPSKILDRPSWLLIMRKP